MANIGLNGLRVILTKECELDEVLIDFSDCKSNLTSKPLFNSIYQQSILDKYKEIVARIKSENKDEYQTIIFIITLMFKKLIKINKPIKMIEIGSLDGWMSRYFADILKYFNENNELVCIDLFDEQVETKGMFKFTNGFELYKNNINTSNSADIVNTVISNPIKMLDIISDNSFEIIFINYRYSNNMYINKYINKLKCEGLFIADLKQDYNQLNQYNQNCFDEFVDIDGIITVYSNIRSNEKNFFKIESSDSKYNSIYNNIFDTTRHIIEIIEYIINNLNELDTLDKIEHAIRLITNVEDILIEINNKLINNDLKYYTSEVKNSLIDIMIELKEGGESIDVFKQDLLNAAIIWSDLIEIEFSNKN